MKLNTKTVMVDLGGNSLTQPAKGPEDENGNATVIQEEITLQMILVNALVNEDPKNPVPGMKKVEMFNLAQKIHDNDEVSLTAEEIALIKERVLAGYAVLIVGQVVKL